MGCVNMKPSPHSPSSSLEERKRSHGYVGGARGLGGHGRAAPLIKHMEDAKLSRMLSRYGERDDAAGAAGNGGAEEGKVVAGEGIGDGEGVSQPAAASGKSGGDDVAGGWPKWLTDNIPREALAGLVPKSAESYRKLDKVRLESNLFFLFYFYRRYC